ncbi:MAG TPA: hypothetical protein VFZ04_09380 [Longimicrobiales bacterium]
MKRLFTLAAFVSLAGCADTPLAPESAATNRKLATTLGREVDAAIVTMRRATDRYHRIEVARNDGFVLLHPCEVRPDEGPVGIVYVNFARLLDGVIDPALPDALIYEPGPNGTEKLVGVEFAVLAAPGQDPPTYLGNVFQLEEEFGVFALHAWVWKSNPEGMFAESNPRVSCS